MAVAMGKRKRSHDNDSDDDDDDDHELSVSEDKDALRALFQRSFEDKFAPLEHAAKLTKMTKLEEPEEEPSQDESEWSGLSEESYSVNVVNYDTMQPVDPENGRQEMKAFMSSKPPVSQDTSSSVSKQQTNASGEDSADAANLKNDLGLQRLLKESHLLYPTTFKGQVAAPDGKGRLEALDLRMTDLGAKESLSKQQNMPQSHRRGIIAKTTDREGKRRREAKDNGVILEKVKGSGQVAKQRQRSIGRPSLGKFKSGTLKLSSRDVRSINGTHQQGLPKGRKVGR